MVHKLATGWTVVMDGVSYTVTGATRKRGQICYLLTDAAGQRQALRYGLAAGLRHRGVCCVG